MADIGELRNWLQGYWNREGARLMQNDGVKVTPEYQRQVMLHYIDGEKPSAPGVPKWLRLSPEEKRQHLEDAFPDQS
jgi:hypothetical protein